MGQKYTSISDLYKQVKLNEQEIIERKLTPQELEDREKIAKKLPMADFKKRYGKDAMAVKMATATNICLLYTSPSPRDKHRSRMPSSA